MRLAIASIILLLLAGCGTTEVLEPEPSLVFPDEPRCLSCDVKAPPELAPIEAAPSVRASPTELMFYPIHGADDEHEPRWVTVTNHYDFIVMLTRVQLADDLSPGNRTGGADYFVVEPIESWIELQPAEAVALPVWFAGSEKQRSAVLSIFTTAYAHRRLDVDLTGKTIFE